MNRDVIVNAHPTGVQKPEGAEERSMLRTGFTVPCHIRSYDRNVIAIKFHVKTQIELLVPVHVDCHL